MHGSRSFNVVALRRARLVLQWVGVTRRQSLTIHPRVGAMSTSQSCGINTHHAMHKFRIGGLAVS